MKILNNKIKLHILIIILISLFLEIFIFNIHSFRLVGQNYNTKSISIEDCKLLGLEKVAEGQYKVTSDVAVIQIEQINEEVRYVIY